MMTGIFSAEFDVTPPRFFLDLCSESFVVVVAFTFELRVFLLIFFLVFCVISSLGLRYTRIIFSTSSIVHPAVSTLS